MTQINISININVGSPCVEAVIQRANMVNKESKSVKPRYATGNRIGLDPEKQMRDESDFTPQ